MRTGAIVLLVSIAVVAILCFDSSFVVASMGFTAFFFLCLAQEIIEVVSNKIDQMKK